MEIEGEAVLPIGLTLESLFSRNGYRAMMGLKRLQPEEYFGNRGPAQILQIRNRLLERRSRDFVCEPARREDCDAVLKFAGSFERVSHAQTFCELGKIWEPDFVLVQREKSAEIVGGCVCFPTGWSLEEKQDHPLSFAHSPVPGLNPQLGPSVERFFSHLQAPDCYQRSNWSLTSSRQMNQRPQDSIPEIKSDCDPTQTFLRIEWQALASLDDRRVIFGIRIYHLTLETVRRQGEAAQLLAENLRTMSAEMLRYKRLAGCRDRVVELMDSH
jgi:hypothetical protein